MTIYTLFLYVALAALALWASIGYGHARLSKQARTFPWQWYIQYFLGALLLFSGFVKAIDPIGTAFKMKDYFAFFEFQGFPFMPFFYAWSLEFSVAMIVAELALGFAMVLGIGHRITLWSTLGLMVFFTFLTGFNYLTGFVPKDGAVLQFSTWTSFNEANLRITDCGCFGDFLKLKPVETFVKDIFLTLLCLPLFFGGFQLKEIIPRYLGKEAPKKERLRAGLLTSLSLASLGFCFYNFYFSEPLLDFRPFAEGTNIVQAKKDCQAKNKAAVKVYYNLLNLKDGSRKRIDSDVFLQDSTYWNPQVWQAPTAQDTEEEQIGEKCDSKVQFFSHEIEHQKGYALMILAYDLDKTHRGSFKHLVHLSTEAEKAKKIPTFGVYFRITDANGDKDTHDDADKFRHEFQAAFPLEPFGDDKLIPTIVRANPALILFKDGQIIKKWHHRQAPKSWLELSSFMEG